MRISSLNLRQSTTGRALPDIDFIGLLFYCVMSGCACWRYICTGFIKDGTTLLLTIGMQNLAAIAILS
jgi:hypothetical protein